MIVIDRRCQIKALTGALSVFVQLDLIITNDDSKSHFTGVPGLYRE